MSRAKPEPVKPTCPKIDKATSQIKDVVTSLNDFVGILENIGVGYNCEFEDLRDDNSSLRDWGNEMREALEDEEFKNGQLEETISELTKELEDLKLEMFALKLKYED